MIGFKLLEGDARKVLKEKMIFGEKAAQFVEVIDEIADRIIESSKSEFEKLPIHGTLNNGTIEIDSGKIIMLQLQMKLARDFSAAVHRAVENGKDAGKQLKKGEENA